MSRINKKIIWILSIIILASMVGVVYANAPYIQLSNITEQYTMYDLNGTYVNPASKDNQKQSDKYRVELSLDAKKKWFRTYEYSGTIRINEVDYKVRSIALHRTDDRLSIKFMKDQQPFITPDNLTTSFSLEQKKPFQNISYYSSGFYSGRTS